MNLGDPELEFIDPTPNVHTLFIHFDKLFFWAKLTSRAVVRWSKRMYSCAGICSYEGRGGLCDIALSEPLLKLRPRKDLIETLLHEMIHAYLFITCQDRERDGHGPNFQSHMHRINRSAGLNISIYHDFHDEVKLYQTHWWRCDGPCQKMRPYYGVVRRSQNRAPGPSDSWWLTHQRGCGGKFVKIKEPEKTTKRNTKEKKSKNNGDIKKYVKNTPIGGSLTNVVRNPLTPLTTTNVVGTPATKMKSNGGDRSLITQNNVKGSLYKIGSPIAAFSGIGKIIYSGKNRSDSVDITETVRNIWANKKLPSLNSNTVPSKRNSLVSDVSTDSYKYTKSNKHKADTVHADSPPAKMKKIDDYFKSTATSLLKDLYGEEFRLTQTDNKIIAVSSKTLVDCPVCRKKVDDKEINRHLDECLNNEVIEKLSKDNIIIPVTEDSSSKTLIFDQSVDKKTLKEIVGTLPPIPAYKKNETDPRYSEKMITQDNGKIKTMCVNTIVDLTNINDANYIPSFNDNPTVKSDTINDTGTNCFDPSDANKVKATAKKINYDKHVRKSDNFIVPKKETNKIDSAFLPSFLDDMGTTIKAPTVKIEPGTSKDFTSKLTEQKCPCCGETIIKPMAEHLDECLAFFDNNTTVPEEGVSTSFANNTIVIDDDEGDIFDETMTLNATGTKTPCPCCLEMIEMAEMNEHLDTCLS